jgi:hypothetical protein
MRLLGLGEGGAGSGSHYFSRAVYRLDQFIRVTKLALTTTGSEILGRGELLQHSLDLT